MGKIYGVADQQLLSSFISSFSVIEEDGADEHKSQSDCELPWSRGFCFFCLYMLIVKQYVVVITKYIVPGSCTMCPVRKALPAYFDSQEFTEAPAATGMSLVLFQDLQRQLTTAWLDSVRLNSWGSSCSW